MTTQYNVPIKVVDPSQEWMIQQSLTPYRVLTTHGGHLDRTCFSREKVPYVGEVIVIKTLKKEVADLAQKVLTGLEGLVVLPTTECEWEQPKAKPEPVLAAC